LKAIVLAAGQGERLEPITHTRPKPFVPVLDKSLILRTIEHLTSLGIKENDIIVVGNENFRNYFESLPVSVVYQKEGKGTASALRTVSGIRADDLLIVYGDLYLERDAIKSVLDAGDNAILGVKVPNPKEFGVLVTDSSNNLTAIVEKPENPPSDLINGGVYRLDSDVFSYLDRVGVSPRGEMELTDAVTAMAREKKVKIVSYSGMWLDVSRPWHVIEINKHELDRVNGEIKGELEHNVTIKGKVVIEEGAEVKAGTYIEGPAYIGKGASVGPNAYVRPYSVLLENSKVGASVEIKESVIMEDTKVPHLSYVGDSVICEHVNLGAGTLIANLRFDEQPVKVTVKGKRESSGRKKLGAFIGGYAKTGINVTILPGVKIGAYAWIYPGSIVDRDVGKGEFYRR
jgi:Nucleoside-diphosphate-sugar pyrophosphorylase involved in lipopolysaccharide biosynthesis/translation initiation factor 2B, gamma/epsilon subunits (eIF-2Bgamma/eIF-2Bepsilon)